MPNEIRYRLILSEHLLLGVQALFCHLLLRVCETKKSSFRFVSRKIPLNQPNDSIVAIRPSNTPKYEQFEATRNAVVQLRLDPPESHVEVVHRLLLARQ
jgi:hypothetical protein